MTPVEEAPAELLASAAAPVFQDEHLLVAAGVRTGVDSEEEHFQNLKSRALHGTYFIVLTTVAGVMLRMLNSIVFSHLFMPEYFGLLALITTILVGLNLFSHLGLQESVIQNPRGDEPDFLNTAWTLQALRQTGIFCVSIALAWPAARFYHEPRILWVLPLLGLGCLISGFSSSSQLTMARHINVRELTLLELFTQFVSFAATVLWAWYRPTLWALVGGRLISEMLRTLVTYRMLPEVRPRWRWDREAVREIVKFGKWILVGTALTFLAGQSDRLILGKLVSLRLLALYGIAYALSDMPRQVILQFCSKVGFPFIAKFMDRPRPEFRRLLLRYRAPVLLVGAVLLSLTICTGDLFITRVYDQRYHGAGWMVAILALGLWHTLLYSTISPAIFALQKSHYNAIAQSFYCATLFVALPLGFHYYGMTGAVVAAALSDLPMYVCFAYSAIREGLNSLVQDLLMTGAFAAILSLSVGVRWALGFGLPLRFAHF